MILSYLRTLLLYLVLIVFFALSNGGAGAAFAMFYSIAMPVNMIAVDERSRFDRLMPMLPVRQIDCVLDKYIGAWGCLAVAVVLGRERPRYLRLLLKPALATAVMALAARSSFDALYGAGFSEKGAVLLAVLLAVAVYGALVLLLRIVTREDLSLLPKGEKIAKFLFKS